MKTSSLTPAAQALAGLWVYYGRVHIQEVLRSSAGAESSERSAVTVAGRGWTQGW